MEGALLYAAVFSCSFFVSFTLTMIAFGVLSCVGARTARAKYNVLEDCEHCSIANNVKNDPTSFVFNMSDDNWTVSDYAIHMHKN